MQNKMFYPILVFLCYFSIACNNDKSNHKNTTPPAKSAGPVASSSMSSSKTIAENIMADTSYTILAKVLISADLMETLNEPGPFTLFIPANNAFKKLPQ